MNGYDAGKTCPASDALLDALEASGDAQRYDINGNGHIVHVSVTLDAEE